MTAVNGDPQLQVVVTAPLSEQQLERLRAAAPDVDIRLTTAEESERYLPTADAIVGWRLTAEQIERAPRLRWLQMSGAGVDGAELTTLATRDVVVTNMSGVHAVNIGEHVLAMMLAFARQLPRLIRAQIARTWSDSNLRGGVFELHGQQLVVVGLGDIGLQVVELAQPFGLRVIGVRRRSLDQTIPGLDRITDLAGLPAALRSADHVVIALPLTHRTRHLFDAEMLAQMKPTAYLYNIGRGAIVDTAALIDALYNGRLAGAGLDVTDPEPLPADSPLWSMENVIITAHTSGATPRYWDRGLAVLEENIRRFAAGEPLVNVVDLAEGY